MNSFILFLIALSLCALTLVAGDDEMSVSGETSPAQADAIRTIYKQWSISDWGGINISSDPCTYNGTGWPHVNCTQCQRGIVSCHITSLNLSSQSIDANISRELFNLEWLSHLDLSNNSISGPIPPAIGKLSNMIYLDLSMNNFSGNIPKEIGNLSKLTHLDLSKNMLSGPVPSKLGDIITLNHLDLSVNMLSDNLPSELRMLRNLSLLKFSTNNFNGPLPQNLTNWTSLEILYFDSSGVKGSLDVLEPLKKLKILWAFDNDIDGNLAVIKNFTELEELRIYGTLIGGSIPHFSNPASIQILQLGDLHSPSANSDFSFLKNMDNLKILTLRNCSLKSPNFPSIPVLKSLTYLDLSFNKLNGTIPSMYTKINFPELTQLFIGGNNFNGSFNDIFSGNLIELDISFNPISGNIPFPYPNLNINFLGTKINAQNYFTDSKSSDILNFIGNKSPENNIRNLNITSAPFAIKCGANVDNISNLYHNDSDPLGAANFNIDTRNQWVVSNVGSFLPNNITINSTVRTDHRISNGAVNQALYQAARVSTSSLKYYIVGLPDGDDYKIEIDFAEIVIQEKSSWRGLGRRYFNIAIQGNWVEKDFNIVDAAHGSYAVITKTYENQNITSRILEIHFQWTGRGTCCIPHEYTYGPLVSAIRVSRGQSFPSPSPSLGKTAREKAGIAVGILSLGIASLLISSSIVYLWWKWIRLNHVMKG